MIKSKLKSLICIVLIFLFALSILSPAGIALSQNHKAIENAVSAFAGNMFARSLSECDFGLSSVSYQYISPKPQTTNMCFYLPGTASSARRLCLDFYMLLSFLFLSYVVILVVDYIHKKDGKKDAFDPFIKT